MVSCDFLRAGLVVLIPLFFLQRESMLPIYITIFLVFCVGRFFVPAKLAIVPDLVSGEQLFLANSMVHTTGMAAAVVGFGLSGILIEKIGVRYGFYLDSLSFFISAALIFLIAKDISRRQQVARESLTQMRKEFVETIRRSVAGEIKEGILYIAKHPQVRFIVDMLFVLWAALGAVYVVSIVFIQEQLSSITKDLGLLAMFLGAGLLGGTLLYGRLGHRFSAVKAIFASLALSGGFLILFALGLRHYPSFWLAAGLTLLLGIGVSPIMVASNTLVHQVADNHMRGRTFSALEIVMHLAFLLAMFVSASLAEVFGKANVLVGVGLLIGLIGMVGSINTRWLYYEYSPAS
jgi:MFS family permease